MHAIEQSSFKHNYWGDLLQTFLFEIILMCRMVHFINADTQKLEPYFKDEVKAR